MKTVDAHWRKTARGGATVRIRSYVSRTKSTGLSRSLCKQEIVQPLVKTPFPTNSKGNGI